MAKIETKYIDWCNVPDAVRTELVGEADMVSQDDLDSRIVLYEATLNHILVANSGLGVDSENHEDREHSIELVEFVNTIFDHDTDWYIVE